MMCNAGQGFVQAFAPTCLVKASAQKRPEPYRTVMPLSKTVAAAYFGETRRDVRAVEAVGKAATGFRCIGSPRHTVYSLQ